MPLLPPTEKWPSAVSRVSVSAIATRELPDVCFAIGKQGEKKQPSPETGAGWWNLIVSIRTQGKLANVYVGTRNPPFLAITQNLGLPLRMHFRAWHN